MTVSLIFAGGVALVGLLVAALVAARQHAAPSLRLVSQHTVKPRDVRVDDWLEGHGRVTSVEPLANEGVLVRTAKELIVCRSDEELPVLRKRGDL